MQRLFNRQMRALIALLVIALMAYLADIRLPPPVSTPELGGFYRVMQVYDGDTISILKDSERVSVRLVGIDSPEVDTPYTKGECFGKEASAAAKQLMNGATVRIETDPTQDMYDKYNRLLAYVYVPTDAHPDGVMANAYMVKEGFAREYTFNKPYVHQAEFKTDEQEARSANKGLWSACPTS